MCKLQCDTLYHVETISQWWCLSFASTLACSSVFPLYREFLDTATNEIFLLIIFSLTNPKLGIYHLSIIFWNFLENIPFDIRYMVASFPFFSTSFEVETYSLPAARFWTCTFFFQISIFLSFFFYFSSFLPICFFIAASFISKLNIIRAFVVLILLKLRSKLMFSCAAI